MKTKFLKFGLPIAVFALAIFGAFASQKTESKNLALEVGWVDAPSPCQVQVTCSNDLGPVCTMFYQGQNRQVYGKVNLTDPTCSKILYRAPINN